MLQCEFIVKELKTSYRYIGILKFTETVKSKCWSKICNAIGKVYWNIRPTKAEEMLEAQNYFRQNEHNTFYKEEFELLRNGDWIKMISLLHTHLNFFNSPNRL